MNRINSLFQQKQKDVLSVYFTAGHPALNETVAIIEALAANGVDMIEIGMPFSDPLADGPTIQQSSQKALKNGMTISLLFEQLKDIRKTVNVPMLLMGYLNPVMQFGFEKFCQQAAAIGIDGIILPDMPRIDYEKEYKKIMDTYDLKNIFLITPQTSEERIRKIDMLSDGFIYMVSSASTTGATTGFGEEQTQYFKRLQEMKLSNKTIIGFGISNNNTFTEACNYANGAIIGSAFVKALEQEGSVEERVQKFVSGIRNVS